MNKVFLIGNLTRDPELSETNNGVPFCRFGIAVNRNFASADGTREVDFFNVIAWRGLAETVAKYTKKGNKVAILGSIQINSYDAQDGTKKQSVDVVANEVEFLTPKGDSGEGDSGASYQRPQSQRPVPKLEPFDGDDDSPF